MKWLAVLLFSFTAHAAFDQNSLRYLTPWDFVFKLKGTFPEAKSTCSNLKSIADDFGTSSPATGAPVANSPSPLTIRWVELCVNEVTERAFAKEATLWSTHSSAEQKQILLDLLHQILGPEAVIASYPAKLNVSDLVAQAQTRFATDAKLTTREVKKRWALALVLRDEYLSY